MINFTTVWKNIIGFDDFKKEISESVRLVS